MIEIGLAIILLVDLEGIHVVTCLHFFCDDDFKQFDIIYINGSLESLHQACNCGYNFLQLLLWFGHTRIHIEVIIFQVYTYVTSQTCVNNHKKIQQ